ncbi:hypothetical protein R80B4_00487 [Fibrobacteres bacterium R8-0-B4]
MIKTFWPFIVGAAVGLALGAVIGETYFHGVRFGAAKKYSPLADIDIGIPVSVIFGCFGAVGGFLAVSWIQDKRAGNWEDVFKEDDDDGPRQP